MKHTFLGSLVIGAAVALSVATTGCCGKKGGGSTGGGSGETGELVTIPAAGVKFNAPGGWSRYSSGEWVRFKPADNYARLAFVTFDKPGESTARIGQIAGQLDIGAVSWKGNPKSIQIGPNKLPAQVGEGDCKIGGNGDACYVEYATVNPGGSNQLLIVYVVNTVRGAHHKPNVSAAVRSLSKM